MTIAVHTLETAAEAAPGPEPRVIRVALAGFGTVGGALVGLLRDREDAIARTHGIRFELVSILVRDPERSRPYPVPGDLLTSDVEAFLAADAHAIVEVLGGLEPAGRIAIAALGRGRTFVTANKALIAKHGPELAAAASGHGGRLLYEAAVAGGVPIIRALRDALPETGVQGIRGILNGTTNYILTRLSDGATFDQALAEARKEGYAESDSSRDLDGRDTEDKIRILAWLAFGADPGVFRVHRRGLTRHADRIAADADAFGGVARLVGECLALDGGLVAAVEPVIVSPGSSLARTLGADNFIEVETTYNGTLGFSGPGAGGGPTASAILSDLIRHVPHPPAPENTPMAVADGRELAWVVSIRSAGAVVSLRDLLMAEGVDPVLEMDDGCAGILRVRTAPCHRSRIKAVERALEGASLEPVVTRFESGGFSSA
jgi:homoserine dehydrogenase